MSFSSLSPLSHSPHPYVVDLTQNALMTNPSVTPQGQQIPISDTTTSQPSTANRQTAQKSEFEESEGDSLINIFLQIKSEFPLPPSLSDQNNFGEIQYKFSSDDLGDEAQSLPSLEPSSQACSNSNLSLAQGLKGKRKMTSNLIETKKRAKRLKGADYEEAEQGEEYPQNEILTKSKADKDRSYLDKRKIDRKTNKRKIDSKENIKELTEKTLEILKTNFPQKPDFRSIMVGIINIPHNETEKKVYVDSINRIFNNFLSDRWKSRFISALSLCYKQPKVNFLKQHIVPLLLPETAKILQEVVETYKPGGTTVLRDAVKKLKTAFQHSALIPFVGSSLLTTLLEAVVQYAKNLLGKPKVFLTSSYLTDISNMFTTLDDEKIQLLNAVLPKFSIEDLNMLAQWIPEIKKPIDDEIARRASQVPQ